MSAVKIEISSEHYGFQYPRTTVWVDGSFAYQSQNHPKIEKEQIEKLLDLLVIENVEIVVKDKE